jgi:hypothetical protein
LPANFNKTLGNQLKSLTAAAKLVRVKSSFKLGEELKKAPKKKVVKKPAAKKPGMSSQGFCSIDVKYKFGTLFACDPEPTCSIKHMATQKFPHVCQM